MQIGQVIRKYRKEKGMTQEEMAGRLGVTAPAVNKWENGNSTPDIGLLAPIARLLGITVDELLSFREELTEEEIRQFIQEMDERLKSGSFEEALQWSRQMIERYPGSGKLILCIAVQLDAWRLVEKVQDAEKYDTCISDWYNRALESEDEDVRFQAVEALYGFYFRKEEYEKAESYLNYYSAQNPEKKRKQADICWKTGRMEDAYRMYEELLFAGCGRIDLYLTNLFRLAVEEKDMDKARLIVEKQVVLARLFDRGRYQEASYRLQLAMAEKDADEVMESMETILENVESMMDYQKSPLFEHMKFGRLSEDFSENLKEKLRKISWEDAELAYLRENPRWRAMCRVADT